MPSAKPAYDPEERWKHRQLDPTEWEALVHRYGHPLRIYIRPHCPQCPSAPAGAPSVRRVDTPPDGEILRSASPVLARKKSATV